MKAPDKIARALQVDIASFLLRKNPRVVSIWCGRKKEILFSIMKGGGIKGVEKKGNSSGHL
jgi:hypothetical protein